MKVIPGEELALQHQLPVCNMRFDMPPKPKRKFMPRLNVWKLKDPQRRNHFKEVFNLHVRASAGYTMLPLRIYGTTSRKAFSRQLRRCVTQLGPTIVVAKPGGGMSMWERSLQPSRKLSRHGRLVKTLEHHTMQPNALLKIQCTTLAKKPTRKSI